MSLVCDVVLQRFEDFSLHQNSMMLLSSHLVPEGVKHSCQVGFLGVFSLQHYHPTSLVDLDAEALPSKQGLAHRFMHSFNQDLLEPGHPFVVESVLFLPDIYCSLDISIGTLAELLPNLVNGVGLLLVSVHSALHILFPCCKDSLLDLVVAHLGCQIIILIMSINWLQSIVIPSSESYPFVVLTQFQEDKGEGLQLLLAQQVEFAVHSHFIECLFFAIMGASIKAVNQHLCNDEFGLPIILVVNISPLDSNFSHELVV
jgi:hypothetical protein